MLSSARLRGRLGRGEADRVDVAPALAEDDEAGIEVGAYPGIGHAPVARAIRAAAGQVNHDLLQWRGVEAAVIRRHVHRRCQAGLEIQRVENQRLQLEIVGEVDRAEFKEIAAGTGPPGRSRWPGRRSRESLAVDIGHIDHVDDAGAAGRVTQTVDLQGVRVVARRARPVFEVLAGRGCQQAVVGEGQRRRLHAAADRFQHPVAAARAAPVRSLEAATSACVSCASRDSNSAPRRWRRCRSHRAGCRPARSAPRRWRPAGSRDRRARRRSAPPSPGACCLRRRGR